MSTTASVENEVQSFLLLQNDDLVEWFGHEGRIADFRCGREMNPCKPQDQTFMA